MNFSRYKSISIDVFGFFQNWIVEFKFRWLFSETYVERFQKYFWVFSLESLPQRDRANFLVLFSVTDFHKKLCLPTQLSVKVLGMCWRLHVTFSLWVGTRFRPDKIVFYFVPAFLFISFLHSGNGCCLVPSQWSKLFSQFVFWISFRWRHNKH